MKPGSVGVKRSGEAKVFHCRSRAAHAAALEERATIHQEYPLADGKRISEDKSAEAVGRVVS